MLIPTGEIARLSDADRERMRALFFASLSRQDAAIGKLIQRLEDAGRWESTLFVVTGDVVRCLRRAGLDIPPERAIRWITSNAAKSLGIQEQTGTLAPGKMADVVIWNGDPFSVYAQADQVFVDGRLMYDRADPALQPVSDFELGQQPGASE